MDFVKQIEAEVNKEIKKIEKAAERAVKGMVVDLAGNTPFDTGYHAQNWQVGKEAGSETIGTYNKYHKRDYQDVLNKVSGSADKYHLDLMNDERICLFNNGEFIGDLEAGRPTAGTGPNANPGFMKAIENTWEDRLNHEMNKS